MGVYKGQINNIEIGIDVVVNDYAYNYGSNSRLLDLSQRFDHRDDALSLLLTEYIPQLRGVMQRFGVTSKRFYALTDNISGRNAWSPFGLTDPVNLETSSPAAVVGPKGNTIQQISTSWLDGISAHTTGSGLYNFYSFFNGECHYSGTGTQVENGTVFILPSNAFVDEVIPADFAGPIEWCNFSFEAALDNPSIYEPDVWVARVSASITHGSTDYTAQYLDWFGGVRIIPEDDPLDQDGNSSTTPSGGSPYTGAGGVGTHGSEVSDAQSWPTPPSLSAINGGLVTLYAATSPQPMQDLGDFLWSGLDLNSLKKLFVDPMDAIFGAAILPCTPTVSASPTSTIKFGNIDTEVVMPVVTRQYVELDFGTISIREKWGAFLDYSPYTKVTIWLPYIGFKELNVDEVMNNPVGVHYIVDCLTGGCSATVGTLTSDGKLHMCGQYAGSCAMEVPLSSNNWSSMLGAAVSIAGSVGGGYMMGGPVGAAVAGGLSLTNAAVSGSMKPTIERSGSVSGPAGFYAIQYPYVIVERPRQSKPLNYPHFEGYPSNDTFLLSNLQGFTKVESVHLTGVPALADELDEIEALLKQGVII